MAAIRDLYLSRGHPDPTSNNYALKQLITGLRRSKPCGSAAKLPITITILRLMSTTVRLNHPTDTACMCGALLAFFAMLRKGNLTPDSASAAGTATLTRGDILVDHSDYTLWIRLRHTKTIQFGERVLFLPIRGSPGSPIDPIAWWERHLRLSPAHHTDPALMSANGPTTRQRFIHWTKANIAYAGLNPTRYSGHSYRRGGATFAFSAGAPAEWVRAIGDWRSSAYLRYITISEELKKGLAALMADAAQR